MAVLQAVLFRNIDLASSRKAPLPLWRAEELDYGSECCKTSFQRRSVERRIRNPISILRQSKSDQEKRSAQKLLLKDQFLTSKVRHDMFAESFNSAIDEVATELMYPGDQPLKTDDVAYLVVREMLLRIAEETDVDAAQAIAEGAPEVVELNFGRGEVGRNYLTDADFG